jgi:hypothetical protein
MRISVVLALTCGLLGCRPPSEEFLCVTEFVVDSPRNRAMFVECDRTVSAVDLSTGARLRLADRFEGGTGPLDVVLDPSRDVLMGLSCVPEVGPCSIVRFDLAANEWSGEDVELRGLPLSLALDPTRDQALVYGYDFGPASIETVDLASGESVVLADVGSRTWGSMAVDPNRDRLLMSQPDGVWGVDLSTGELGIAYDSEGPRFDRPLLVDISVDPTGDVVYALEDDPHEIALHVLRIDLETGERTDMGDLGSGPAFKWPRHLDWDSGTGRLVVLDEDRPAIFFVDPATGDRELLQL